MRLQVKRLDEMARKLRFFADQVTGPTCNALAHNRRLHGCHGCQLHWEDVLRACSCYHQTQIPVVSSGGHGTDA